MKKQRLQRRMESGQAMLELTAMLVGLIAMMLGVIFVAGLALADNRTLLSAKVGAERGDGLLGQRGADVFATFGDEAGRGARGLAQRAESADERPHFGGAHPRHAVQRDQRRSLGGLEGGTLLSRPAPGPLTASGRR